MRDHWRMVCQRELKRLQASSSSFTRRSSWMVQNQQGFALPIAMAMGMVMTVMGLTAIMVAQGDRNTAFQRKETNASFAVSEGGIARTLAQLSDLTNSILLTSDYDTINPKTGTTYLGPDGVPNSGDEESTPVDEWSKYSANASACDSGGGASSPTIALSDTMGQVKLGSTSVDTGSYSLKAYRYNSSNKTGTLLVQGRRGDSESYIAITITVESFPADFPGLVAMETIGLEHRAVEGTHGNVYFDPAFSAEPSLTGSAAPGDADRPLYNSAINAAIDSPDDVSLATNGGWSGTSDDDGDDDDGWSGTSDDAGSGTSTSMDNIAGTIIACKLTPTLSYTPQGTDLGDINGTLSLVSTGSGITHYQANKINLDNEVVDIDTTDGPVYLYIGGDVTFKNAARLRNIRTDGLPARVGDLRIFMDASEHIDMEGPGCIENAFIYAPSMKLHLMSGAGGCPSSSNAVIEGVVWALEAEGEQTHTAGVIVPEDVSSLMDVLDAVGLSSNNKLGYVKNWQYVKY